MKLLTPINRLQLDPEFVGLLPPKELAHAFHELALARVVEPLVVRHEGCVLHCAGLAIVHGDTGPELHVENVVAVHGGQLLLGAALTAPIVANQTRFYLHTRLASHPVLDAPSALSFRDAGAYLSPHADIDGQVGLELVRLQPGTKTPTIDRSWWPACDRVSSDRRSLRAAEALRSAVTDPTPRLQYALHRLDQLGWTEIIPTLFDWLTTRHADNQEMLDWLAGLSPLPDAEIIAAIAAHLEDENGFPAEIGDLHFIRALEPTKSSEEQGLCSYQFDGTMFPLPGRSQAYHLAVRVAAQNTQGFCEVFLRTSKGTFQRPVLHRNCGVLGEVGRAAVQVEIRQGQLLQAALYTSRPTVRRNNR